MKLDDILKNGDIRVKLYETREIWFNLYDNHPIMGSSSYSYGSDTIHRVFISRAKAISEAKAFEDNLRNNVESLDKFDKMRVAEQHGVNCNEDYRFRVAVFEYDIPIKDLVEKDGEIYFARSPFLFYMPENISNIDNSIFNKIKFTPAYAVEHKIE
ncbi:hypothetical protein HYT23_04120 [Candidatus Pacearchaeota archaeon]|nr:hypothetical protein [Candidatus Pacearchaeota archaeon]